MSSTFLYYLMPDVMKFSLGDLDISHSHVKWDWPLTFDHQIVIISSLSPKVNICTKFDKIPSRCSRDITFTRLRKSALWGHNDLQLWPPKSNQFILESNWTICTKCTKFFFLKYRVHKNGTYIEVATDALKHGSLINEQMNFDLLFYQLQSHRCSVHVFALWPHLFLLCAVKEEGTSLYYLFVPLLHLSPSPPPLCFSAPTQNEVKQRRNLRHPFISFAVCRLGDRTCFSLICHSSVKVSVWQLHNKQIHFCISTLTSQGAWVIFPMMLYF